MTDIVDLPPAALADFRALMEDVAATAEAAATAAKNLEPLGVDASVLRSAVDAAKTALEECSLAVHHAMQCLIVRFQDGEIVPHASETSDEPPPTTGIYSPDTAGESSMSESESDELATDEEEEEEDGDDDTDSEAVQDVVPVYGVEAANLNELVVSRIETALGDATKFAEFKQQAMEFGTNRQSALAFYTYLESIMTEAMVDEFILDFARLLANDEQRLSLLRAHGACLHLRQQQKRHEAKKPKGHIGRKTSLTSSCGTEADDYFPTELHLSTVNHLMFIIHGIGQHGDFKEGERKNWDGTPGTMGDNYIFRDLFRALQETHFKEVPIALEMQSIEWHEELHEPTGVDAVFDIICPEGSSGIRQFNKETFMDLLYYLSPQYGQIIVDSVTEQLNSKYKIFLEEHPGWNGKVSIFGHSLGSVITYDILTHSAGEVAKNGVRFKGLDFAVENFFGAGSPVPVMILSRGDLDLTDGKFTPGIKMPNCKHYFNIFHPIDPIAYRVEPLIHPDMHEKPPVQLIPAQSCKGIGFAKMQEMLERITPPGFGFQSRIDYVMRRRKREGVIELAYAAGSHSSYWDSEDVVLLCLMQICRPVAEKLRRYMSAQQPLPSMAPRGVVPITPHSPVQLVTTAHVRERSTGYWHTRTLLLDHKRVYVMKTVEHVVCRKRWSLHLTPKTVVEYGDDIFTLRVIPEDAKVSHSFKDVASSFLSSSGNGKLNSIQVLKAATTDLRDEWLEALQDAIDRLSSSSRRHTSDIAGMDLPQGTTVDYFGATKTSLLGAKTHKAKTWYEGQGFATRWFVLHDTTLSCYENCPNLVSFAHFPLARSTIYGYPKRCLFRAVTPSGTSMDFKLKDTTVYELWRAHMASVEKARMVVQEDIADKSALVVSLDTQLHTKHRLGVQTYVVLTDDKGSYAAFEIRIQNGDKAATVLRRYSAFRQLHRELRELFPHEQMPPLPPTRLWAKLDPVYLAAKCNDLNSYLTSIESICTTAAAAAILQAFLDVDSSL
ncbi:phospholipase [Achlya hypogyna]|uniref:Phospholipase n=1 Tax=Achlya hypogyna TaxID=1202772 RepID=A0A1V9ZKT4_ACHHY|nr:phospholipase [Achlya hypogyna]